jgi:hypothetical protein
MTRPLTRFALLGLLGLGAIVAAFRQGWVPTPLSPLPLLDLSVHDPWFLDWRLAETRRDPEICRKVLAAPLIAASRVADQPLQDGCGWENAVRISTLGSARFPIDTLRCDSAGALAMWVAHGVQPAAQATFGQRVASITHMGGYACRNIIGNPLWKTFRSTHAQAHAIDISGFVLADGRRITVAKAWAGDSAEARFLRLVHKSACRYFRIVLGPDYNKAHHDHFHFDRGVLWRCT